MGEGYPHLNTDSISKKMIWYMRDTWPRAMIQFLRKSGSKTFINEESHIEKPYSLRGQHNAEARTGKHKTPLMVRRGYYYVAEKETDMVR